jgi:hypothetical protein
VIRQELDQHGGAAGERGADQIEQQVAAAVLRQPVQQVEDTGQQQQLYTDGPKPVMNFHARYDGA